MMCPLKGWWNMSSRKTICRYCKKIIDESSNHVCKGTEQKRLNYNKQKREYYRKNKETQKPLTTKKWRTFRKVIINRDDHLCKRCYIKYGIINGDELQVHHIKPRIHYPELMFDEDNVVTLCKTCNVQLGLNGIDFEWENEKLDFQL